jgi:DNA-binding FrmR family transcriptional regulator
MTDICESGSAHADHSALLGRLRRVEGQVRGVARMIEDERYCIDILTQISAAKSALTAVEREVLKAHADHCVANAMASGDPDEQNRKMSELIGLLLKAGK